MKQFLEKSRALFSRHAEWLALLLVLLGAAAMGAFYLFAVIGPLGPDHSNELIWFSPSVMFASGRGMVTPEEADIPGLSDFLRMRTDRFDPAGVPEKFRVWDLSPFCRTHYYLLTAVGVVWRVFGISWQSVKLVPLFLFLATAAFVYGLFRLGMGRALSVLFSLAVMCSPPMLGMTVSIRDFSKAPFILGAVYLAALLAVRPLSRRGLLGLSVAAGLLLGAGLGFRQDAMIVLPPALAAALIARGRTPLRWWLRLAAPVLMAVAFVAAGAPILRAIRSDEGAVSSHTLFQGLSLQTESGMDFSGASYYLLPNPADNLVHSVINTYARRTGDTEPMENYLSPAYGRAGRRMFMEVVRNFPADLLDRGYAAVLALFRVPEEFPRQMAYAKGMDNDWMRGLVRLYAPVSAHLARWGLWYALLAFLIIGAADLRAAVAAGFALLYLGGYTSLLFQYRHAFHLAFMPWWAAVFLLAVAGRAAAAVWRRMRGQRKGEAPPAGKALREITQACALGGAALLALVLPLGAARLWQNTRVDRIARDCASSPREPLDTVREDAGGRALFRLASRPKGLADSDSRPPMEASYDYLVMEIETGEKLVPVTLEYDKAVFGNNFTQTINVEPPSGGRDGMVCYFFPVYEVSAIPPPEGKLTVYTGPVPWKRGRFLGISLAAEDAGRLKGLYRVSGASSMALLPFIWEPPDPADLRRHNSTPLEGQVGAVWANAAARVGDPGAALARYRRLLRWHPAEQRLYAGIDALLDRCPGKWDAVELWRQLAAAHPDQPFAQAGLALAMAGQGRYEEAKSVLQAAMELMGLRQCLCGAFLHTMVRSGDYKGAENYIRWCHENNAPLSRPAERAAQRVIDGRREAAP